MKRLAFVIVPAITVLAMCGCQSQQAKIDSAQKEYDTASQQFGKDCGAEYRKAQPNFTAQCKQESDRMAEAYKKLQAQRAEQ